MSIEVVKALSEDGYMLLLEGISHAATEAIKAKAFTDARQLAYLAEQIQEARK